MSSIVTYRRFLKNVIKNSNIPLVAKARAMFILVTNGLLTTENDLVDFQAAYYDDVNDM